MGPTRTFSNNSAKNVILPDSRAVSVTTINHWAVRKWPENKNLPSLYIMLIIHS